MASLAGQTSASWLHIQADLLCRGGSTTEEVRAGLQTYMYIVYTGFDVLEDEFTSRIFMTAL